MVEQFLQRNPFYQKVLRLYDRYGNYFPFVSFLAGFGWDNLTLRRIDQWFDNIQLFIYLILLGICIVLVNLINSGNLKHPGLIKFSKWYPLAIQFFLGGLFSAYVVFYFHSASFTKTSLFLIILLFLLVANEFLENQLTNLYLQTALFFVAAFSFFIFFLPVLTGIMNLYMFFAGGALSVLFVMGLLFFLQKKSAIPSVRQYKRVNGLVLFLFVGLNGFYFLNWIPPVPLSLKAGEIFHHVKRVGNLYRVQYETPRWYQFWKNSDNEFHFATGDTVFCYASVFAPARLKTEIYHHWQYYNERQKKWQTTDRLSYPISGGRDGGYRGYTFKRHLQPGKWRVDVENEQKQLLGRITFTLKPVPTRQYQLKTEFR